MEQDVRASFERMSRDMESGFATLRAEITTELTARMDAGFARMERYFELSQAQYVELRTSLHLRSDELSQRVDELSQRVDELSQRVDDLSQRVQHLAQRVDALELEVGALRSELRSLRDWAATEVGELRAEARLHQLRQDVDRLSARVTRLEE
jgi:outer membrane murein-binding lipoprotein Lpp